MDMARWAMGIDTHPVKIHCTGGKFGRDDDQEVPNVLSAQYEYANGMLIQNEVRSLYTNPEGMEGSGDCFIYSDQGWMTINNGFKTYFGRKNEPGPSSDTVEEAADPMNFTGAGGGNHFGNFVEALRSGKRDDLTCDIETGYMSSALPHLANIAYRVERTLTFNGEKERFKKDPEADRLLTREYREPFVVPDEV